MAAAEVTARQLAQECGVSPQSVHKWMRGLCAPRSSHLLVISKMTEANIEWLMIPEPVPLRAAAPRECALAQHDDLRKAASAASQVPQTWGQLDELHLPYRRFIALANPERILALLDERDALAAGVRELG
jgi:transcriptional regulator with XRE-family HTH domain